jgi:chromosome segregation ATPase
MKLEDRLGRVLQRQFELIQELRRTRADVARARSTVQMRIAGLEQQERDARKHHEDAVAEGDPQAESLRDWPDKARARIEELKVPVEDLAAAERRVTERIEAAEQDVEDFRLLQPQLAASVVAARNAGVGREIFDTLNDALNYIELALDTAAEEDPNGPLRAAPSRGGGSAQAESVDRQEEEG